MNARDYSAIRHPSPMAHPVPTHIPAPCPQFLDEARAQPDYLAMDETGDFAVTNAKFDRLTDDQIEQLTDAADQAASAEQLEDVQHEMRVEWRHALDNQHALSTPKLPTVEAGKLVMVPVTELIGTLMDSCRAVQLLCDALRTGELNALHLQIRTDWIEGNAADLARIGWAA